MSRTNGENLQFENLQFVHTLLDTTDRHDMSSQILFVQMFSN